MRNKNSAPQEVKRETACGGSPLFQLYKINDSAVSDVQVATIKKLSELASGNVVAVKLAQLVVPAAGLEPARYCYQRILRIVGNFANRCIALQFTADYSLFSGLF